MCHNGWASNILIVVDTGYAGIHHSKYWMPIHYDTIEDGQNKKSHLLFSNLKSMINLNSTLLSAYRPKLTLFNAMLVVVQWIDTTKLVNSFVIFVLILRTIVTLAQV